MRTYQQQIGDGKLPNKYFVFHYDQKFKNVNGTIEPVGECEETKNSFLGEFKTYSEAVECFDNKAYLPHVVMEDRLTGVILETMCIECPCCGKEDWETINDTKFTQETMEKKGFKFV